MSSVVERPRSFTADYAFHQFITTSTGAAEELVAVLAAG